MEFTLTLLYFLVLSFFALDVKYLIIYIKYQSGKRFH